MFQIATSISDLLMWPYVRSLNSIGLFYFEFLLMNFPFLTLRTTLKIWSSSNIGRLYDFNLDLCANNNNTMDDDSLFTFELTG